MGINPIPGPKRILIQMMMVKENNKKAIAIIITWENQSTRITIIITIEM